MVGSRHSDSDVGIVLVDGMRTILRLPLPQVAPGRVSVSIVQFDQMYWVPISASSRFGSFVERFLLVRLKRQAVDHGHASCLKTRTVTPLSDTGHNFWD